MTEQPDGVSSARRGVSEPPRMNEAATIAGVVLAGVIAIFLTPGTFQPDDMAFGLTLTFVLFAYGHDRVVTGWRGLAFASALGLALLLLLGWPADQKLPFSVHAWLTFVTWATLTATVFVFRVLWNAPLGRPPAPRRSPSGSPP